jgi:nucleotide-binding universal stress UspA family protein
MLTLKRILVATDFSEHADRALEWAIEMAKRWGGAAITLLHTYEIPVYSVPDGAFIATADMTARIGEAGNAGLQATLKRYEGAGVTIEPLLRTGPPAEEINSVAQLVGAGLIVLGTHGRRGLSRALLGSVADRVIRTAKVPVLTVHVDQSEAAKK